MAVFSVTFRSPDEQNVQACSQLIEALEALDSIKMHDTCWLVSANTEQFVFYEYVKSHSRGCDALVVFRVHDRPSSISAPPGAEEWLDRSFSMRA